MAGQGFEREFVEIINDLRTDLALTLKYFPAEVQARFEAYAAMLTRSEDPQVLADVKTAMMWMFLCGREHAIRGYARPIPKEGEGDVDLSEDIKRLLEGP